MTLSTRIRINLESKEFEIEGTETFVKSYAEKISRFLDLFTEATKSQAALGTRPKAVTGAAAPSAKTQHNDDMPETFGEYYHLVPDAVMDMDRILIAGYFFQLKSDDNSFTTKDASELLIDQGVKLSNASNSLRQNVGPKNLIKLTKGKFRVSPKGVKHIETLLAGTPAE